MNNSDIPIVSRPAKSAWAGVALALFFGVSSLLIVTLNPPESGESWFFWFVVGASVVGGAAMLIYIARHRIIADENGLRWRGAFTGWKSVRWNEVSDFSLSGQSKEGKIYAVETTQGTLTFGTNVNTSAEALAGFIAQFAVKAPHGEWEAVGLRPHEEFERSFGTREISWRALLLTFVPLVALSLTALPFLLPRDFAQWQAARALDSPEVAVWALWAPFLVLAFLASAMLTAMIAPIVSLYLEREQVIVTHQGLRFEKGEQALEFGWDELRAVHLRNARAHFVSARGDWRMHWLATLRPFIELYAPDVPIDSEAENLDLARPIRLANGALFYSFRTAGLRSMLRVFAAMTVLYAFLPPLMLIGVTSADAPHDDPRWIWIMLVPLAACCLWQWRLYQRGGVALNETGIEVRGAWCDKFYRWDELETRDDKLIIRGSERQVKLWRWGSPVRHDEVRAEIERRVKS